MLECITPGSWNRGVPLHTDRSACPHFRVLNQGWSYENLSGQVEL